jgi:hypothetical protein
MEEQKEKTNSQQVSPSERMSDAQQSTGNCKKPPAQMAEGVNKYEGSADIKQSRFFSTGLFFATMIIMFAFGLYAHKQYPSLAYYMWYLVGVALALCIYNLIFE